MIADEVQLRLPVTKRQQKQNPPFGTTFWLSNPKSFLKTEFFWSKFAKMYLNTPLFACLFNNLSPVQELWSK